VNAKGLSGLPVTGELSATSRLRLPGFGSEKSKRVGRKTPVATLKEAESQSTERYGFWGGGTHEKGKKKKKKKNIFLSEDPLAEKQDSEGEER